MSYAQTVDAARRLAILLALYFAPGYRLPAATVRDQVALTGYVASMDRIAVDLAWLAEQGLVESTGAVARLTARGEDVALGRAQTPGVRRPAPGDA